MMRFHTMFVMCFAMTLSARGLPCSGQTGRLAISIGITPEAIAAADLTSDATMILQVLHEATTLKESLAAHRLSVDQAADALESATRALATTPDDVELQAAFAASTREHADARSDLETAESVLRDHVTAGCSAEKRAMLHRVRAASAYRVPVEFCATERTESQWREIESALMAERRANNLGYAVDPIAAALLANVRSDVGVIQARQLLDSSLANTVATFEQFD